MSLPVSIVWFRHDLRIADHPALHAAAQAGAVLPVYIWSPEDEGNWPQGAASRWWLQHSLESLDRELCKFGSRLIVRKGSAATVLQELVRESSATSLYFIHRYEPAAIEQERQAIDAMESAGVRIFSFHASTLFKPGQILNQSGQPFRVFTPFWKNCLSRSADIEKPIPAPRDLLSPAEWPRSEPLDSLELLPRLNWADGFKEMWEPGEAGAWRNWKRFRKEALKNYEEGRNFPAEQGTSRLSPHLHFGEISPRQVWHELKQSRSSTAKKFLAEIGWREFAIHLLFHFPETLSEPFQPKFAKYSWRKNPAHLRAWQCGQTGYPIVDAGMRELWATGWMHNRVRMITASFLVKDLLTDWREGAAWFWDTLLDADLANNALGWQWVAGCGADAAPFFRIFNPVTQGEKFDPRGDYVRRWIPELAKLPDKWIHQPWRAPAVQLEGAGVVLGKNYPNPIVSHAIAREIALEKYSRIKKAG